MQINQFQNSQLKEFYLKAKMDIELIETNILMNKEKYDGCESSSDEQSLLNQVSSYAKETYNEDVTPDIAGMEGLVEKLKAGFKTIKEALKSKPNKQSLSIIKKDAFQALEAIKVYESDKWLKEQQFINIGNTKFQTPSIFAEIKSVKEAEQLVNTIFTKLEQTFNRSIKDAEKRLSVGMSIFNKYKNKEYTDELSKEVKLLLPIKPEIEKLNKEEYLSVLGTGYVQTSIPVLTKDSLKDITKLMKTLADFSFQMEMRFLDIAESALDYEDFSESVFWEHLSNNVVVPLFIATEWHHIDDAALNPVIEVNLKIIFELAKFLENWILYSVK
ncbi:MAG: hypothetical protein ACRCVV_10405 [Shewanella sp.]